MAARLVAAGAAADAADDAGLTPLMVAANYEARDSARSSACCSRRRRARTPGTRRRDRADEVRAEPLHADTAKLLLAGGAEVNAADRDGYTALMMASRNARTALVETLLAAGADPAARRRTGERARAGEERRFDDVVAILERAGKRE